MNCICSFPFGRMIKGFSFETYGCGLGLCLGLLRLGLGLGLGFKILALNTSLGKATSRVGHRGRVPCCCHH